MYLFKINNSVIREEYPYSFINGRLTFPLRAFGVIIRASCLLNNHVAGAPLEVDVAGYFDYRLFSDFIPVIRS